MNLKKKKELASRTLGVGKNKIYFNPESLNEIKEAITKQDIKTLYDKGIIQIKPTPGRKKVVRRKRRKGPGKIKMKIKHRKQDYVKITRKLRGYLKALRNNEEISREIYYDIRKKIKMRIFKNMANFKEYLVSIKSSGRAGSLTKVNENSKLHKDKKIKEAKKHSKIL